MYLYPTLICGLFFPVFQEMIGMRNLSDGVDYYAEVHTSFWNSLTHTLFMPITVYGFCLFIPALFQLPPQQALSFKNNILSFYIGLYLNISIPTTALVCAWFYTPYKLSTTMYNRLWFSRNPYRGLILSGVTITTCALVIQEVLGHWIGGDDASRLEAVPNAILYAMYYSVSHLVDRIVHLMNIASGVGAFAG